MRILQIAGSGTVGTAAAGPISSVIGHLCNELDRCGHRVLVADAPSAEGREKLPGTVEVCDGLRPKGDISGSGVPGVGALFAAAAQEGSLRAIMNRFRPDVVHVHDAALAIRVSRLGLAPVLWTAHGLNWTMEAARPWAGPRYAAVRRLETAACRRVDHVVVLNETTRRALPPGKSTSIPNGIDLSAWPRLERSCARAYLGWQQGEFRVVYVGRLAPEKGVDVFARAMDQIPRDVPLVAEAMGSPAGSFGPSAKVTRYARELLEGGHRVAFLGFVHRDTAEYRCRLAAADAVVVPSITEPFGLVVLEALACGARVIGSDVGGIRDTLGGGLGRLVPAGDAQALARAVLEEYQHPADREPEATRRALAEFDWQRRGRAYAALMESMTREAA